MTYTKEYTINPNEWEQVDANEYVYIDEALNMRVILEKETTRADSTPWEKMLYNGWVLKADSFAYYDENNYYFYDALADSFTCAPVLTRAHSELFFNDEELKPVLIPDWLIEHAEYLRDQDAEADNDLYEWAQAHDGETFANYEEMHRCAWDWYAKRYINGGQYSDGTDAFLYIGEQSGIIRRNNSAALPTGSYSVSI